MSSMRTWSETMNFSGRLIFELPGAKKMEICLKNLYFTRLLQIYIMCPCQTRFVFYCRKYLMSSYEKNLGTDQFDEKWRVFFRNKLERNLIRENISAPILLSRLFFIEANLFSDHQHKCSSSVSLALKSFQNRR